jgi:hypothetical protein
VTSPESGPAVPAASPDASAQTADLDFWPTVVDAVLAAGIADVRFDPDVLEASARQAAGAWAVAVDPAAEASTAGVAGTGVAAAEDADDALAAVAWELLAPGGPGARARLYVAGPRILEIDITHLPEGADPPLIRLLVRISGRRYIQDSDTGELVSGDRDLRTTFYEFWSLELTGPPSRPWRLGPGSSPGSVYEDSSGLRFVSRRETEAEYRERAGTAGASPPAAAAGDSGAAAAGDGAGQPRRFLLSCGFFEHDVKYGGTVTIVVRSEAVPTRDQAVELVLPAIIASITRSTGDSDWRPMISSLEVRELLG